MQVRLKIFMHVQKTFMQVRLKTLMNVQKTFMQVQKTFMQLRLKTFMQVRLETLMQVQKSGGILSSPLAKFLAIIFSKNIFCYSIYTYDHNVSVILTFSSVLEVW